MKKIEATQSRPFYSVSYVYERSPWTCHSYNFWGMGIEIERKFNGRTQEGTDAIADAMQAATELFRLGGFAHVYVTRCEDTFECAEILDLKPGKGSLRELYKALKVVSSSPENTAKRAAALRGMAQAVKTICSNPKLSEL